METTRSTFTTCACGARVHVDFLRDHAEVHEREASQ